VKNYKQTQHKKTMHLNIIIKSIFIICLSSEKSKKYVKITISCVQIWYCTTLCMLIILDQPWADPVSAVPWGQVQCAGGSVHHVPGRVPHPGRHTGPSYHGQIQPTRPHDSNVQVCVGMLCKFNVLEGALQIVSVRISHSGRDCWQCTVPQIFKLHPMWKIFFDLVKGSITNRKYALFCVF